MAEILINDEIKNALEGFFGGKINVYEAGDDEIRPNEFQERPFFNLLPDNKTYFVESLNNQKNGSYSVSKDNPLKDGSLDTNATKFFKEVEERFNQASPNRKLFVIDPDAIRARYALDESPNRSLAKSIIEYIKEKKEKYNIEKSFPAAKEDIASIENVAFKNINAYSRTEPGNVTKENLKGDFYVSLVVASNVDKTNGFLLFFDDAGRKEYMEKYGIDNETMNRYILYHEFGHALDPKNSVGRVGMLLDNNVQSVYKRHRTECFADVHSVLQLAREQGDTRVGEFIADVRIGNTRRTIELKGKKGLEETKPDFEKELEKIERSLPKPKDAAGKKLVKMQNDGGKYSTVKELSGPIPYYTTPSIDAAIEFAKKGLKDGSLLKMTDAEVLQAADKIVQETELSPERMSALRIAVLKGDENNPDIKAIRKRAEAADNNMPVPKEKIEKSLEDKKQALKEKREKLLKSLIGLPVDDTKKEPAKSGAEVSIFGKKVLLSWGDELLEKVEKEGFTKEGILKIVKEEKDEIRKHHGRDADAIGEAKMKILNETLISHPDVYIAKARIRATVRDTISASKTVPVPDDFVSLSGARVADDFIMMRTISAGRAEISINNSLKADLTTMSPEEYLKCKNQEVINYNKAIIAEKSAQEMAFAICKNKEVFNEIHKLSPTVGDMIEKAAKKRHPSWLENYHLSFGSSDKTVVQKTLQGVVGYNKLITKAREILAEKSQEQKTNNVVKNAINNKTRD